MKYTMTTPCNKCPFLKKFSHGYALKRLKQFAGGEFPCHQTADEVDDDSDDDYAATEFLANEDSQHCAGALIFLEKRESPHQIMRICERLGAYDRTQLNMKAKVR